jgi:hypothetical protein
MPVAGTRATTLSPSSLSAPCWYGKLVKIPPFAELQAMKRHELQALCKELRLPARVSDLVMRESIEQARTASSDPRYRYNAMSTTPTQTTTTTVTTTTTTTPMMTTTPH